MEEVFIVMVVSVMYSVLGMSKWSMVDLILGLYKLLGWYVLEGVVDIIKGVFIVFW